MTPEERRSSFEKKYLVTSGGCWQWAAGRLTSGYGAFFNGRIVTCAHRVSYEFNCGPIPDGLDIDHLCRNKLCVNPDHLEAVTHSVNQRRVFSETHCKRGHVRCPENSLKRADGAYACRLCARVARRESELRNPRNRKKVKS